MGRIYLDFNASTPIAPEVTDAMRPFLNAHYGNPSSHHWAGAPARTAVDAARADVAALIGATPEEIVFTSGGTEANNHAVKGAYFDAQRRSRAGPSPHIITSVVEHPAIHEPCAFVERLGATVIRVPVDRHGRVDPDAIRVAITTETVLISVMHANNEVGTIEPIAEIGAIAREHGILFHTDAAQSLGKIRVSVDELGIDLLSIAGHKLYAPKGVGALFLRSGRHVEPLLHGAGHEQGRRASTENVLLAVGLGAACRLARERPCGDDLTAVTEQLWRRLRDGLGERVCRNGHPVHRLPNTLNVSIRGVLADELLRRVPHIAASTGSACHADSREMSPVLRAMGVDEDVGFGAVRLSTGRTTTSNEVDDAADMILAECAP